MSKKPATYRVAYSRPRPAAVLELAAVARVRDDEELFAAAREFDRRLKITLNSATR